MWQRRKFAMQITMGGWIMNIAWLIFAIWAWLAFEDPLQVQKKRCAHHLHRQTFHSHEQPIGMYHVKRPPFLVSLAAARESRALWLNPFIPPKILRPCRMRKLGPWQCIRQP